MTDDVLTERRIDQPRVEHPQMAAAKGRVEPAPRRVRGVVAGTVVFDTRRALYVWESPYYPQYYVPLADVDRSLLIDEDRTMALSLGSARRHGVRVGTQVRGAAARVFGSDADGGLADHVRFEWSALDSWWEEDEEIFVHPRNPYVRVDAVRSRTRVRVERDGEVLADSDAPVLVFETGLPTRYYVDRADVRWERMVSSSSETACPYKGRTTDFWSVRTSMGAYDDLAWSYQFPLPAVAGIAGLVAFFDEKVDLFLDDVLQARPVTHFS